MLSQICKHDFITNNITFDCMIAIHVFTATTFSFTWEMQVAQPSPMHGMFSGFYALVHTRIHSFLRHICMAWIIAVRLSMRSFFIPPFTRAELLFTPKTLEEAPPSQAPLLHTCHLKELNFTRVLLRKCMCMLS